jgi:predicted permease
VCYTVASIFSPKNHENGEKVNIKYILGRLVRSTPLLSYFVALTINFSGLTFPVFLADLIDIIARANSFLALFLLGLFLSFKFEKSEWINILKVLVLRYSLGLIVGLSLFFLLPSPQFSLLFRLIITLSLILPIGLGIIPFSVEFGYNQKLITMLINLSIMISFVLLWILILILNG